MPEVALVVVMLALGIALLVLIVIHLDKNQKRKLRDDLQKDLATDIEQRQKLMKTFEDKGKDK